MIMQKYDDKRRDSVKKTGQKRTQMAMPHLLDLIFVQIIRPLLRGRREVGASGNAVGGGKGNKNQYLSHVLFPDLPTLQQYQHKLSRLTHLCNGLLNS